MWFFYDANVQPDQYGIGHKLQLTQSSKTEEVKHQSKKNTRT